MLGLETSLNSEHFIQKVKAIFMKIEIWIFFSCELPITLMVGRKKTPPDIFKRTQDIEFERDWSVLGDGHKEN